MDRLTGKHYDRGDYYMECSGSCANDDEMCGGCPWLEKIINRLGSYEDTGLEPEEILEQGSKGVEIDTVKPGWIPVTERLPENDNEVLTANRQTVQILFYDHDDADWYTVDSDNSVHLFCDNVTHWMPLPPAAETAEGGRK